jgi:hypothetical protein
MAPDTAQKTLPLELNYLETEILDAVDSGAPLETYLQLRRHGRHHNTSVMATTTELQLHQAARAHNVGITYSEMQNIQANGYQVNCYIAARELGVTHNQFNQLPPSRDLTAYVHALLDGATHTAAFAALIAGPQTAHHPVRLPDLD